MISGLKAMTIKPRDKFEPDSVEMYNGTSSMVLNEHVVYDALSRREHNEYTDESLRACIGLKNGLIAGTMLWLLIYCMYRVVSL